MYVFLLSGLKSLPSGWLETQPLPSDVSVHCHPQDFWTANLTLQHLKKLFNWLVSGIEGLFLCFNSQLHFLQGLPQQEQLLSLSVMLSLEPPGSSPPSVQWWSALLSVATLLLQEVVEVSGFAAHLAGPGLSTEGAKGWERRSKRGERRGKKSMNMPNVIYCYHTMKMEC